MPIPERDALVTKAINEVEATGILDDREAVKALVINLINRLNAGFMTTREIDALLKDA